MRVVILLSLIAIASARLAARYDPSKRYSFAGSSARRPNPKLSPNPYRKSYSNESTFLISQYFDGIPHSYRPEPEYWWSPDYLDPGNHPSPLDCQESIEDRSYTEHCLNLYDGAMWVIGLALEGIFELPAVYHRQILYQSSTNGGTTAPAAGSGSPGGLQSIRGDTGDFHYGCSKVAGTDLAEVEYPCPHWNESYCNSTDYVPVKAPGASLFRLIGSTYISPDPYLGEVSVSFKGEPSWNQWGDIIWNDWKPITGENVWAMMIGPIQYLYLSNNGTLPKITSEKDVPKEIQLSLTILPAMKALQSPLGSLYHCPEGSKLFPIDPDEGTNVSNENNVSAYAALRMLLQAIQAMVAPGVVPALDTACKDGQSLLDGLDQWFAKYGLTTLSSGNKVFYQGGHVTCDGQFKPAEIEGPDGTGLNFAVDCQTWATASLGTKKIDGIGGEGTVYNMWKEVKARSGYFLDDQMTQIAGVGYTSTGKHDVWSTEWTYGAIAMLREASNYYDANGHSDYAKEMRADMAQMKAALEQPEEQGGMTASNGGMLYANKRFFIPWGWYANRVPSTCSTAWRIAERQQYNPFVLGGGAVPEPSSK